MNKLISPFIFTGFAIFLNGCATPVNSQIPISAFESSETHGLYSDRTNLTGEGGYRGDILAEIIPDVTTEPIVTNRDKMHVGGDLFAGLNGQLHDRLDVGGAIVTSGLPIRGHAKWMFLGEPTSRAKKGDFSLAAVCELSLNTGHHWSDQETELFTGKVYKAEVHETKTSTLTALLAGYRFHDELLIYTGAYYIHATNEGVVEPSINGQRQKDVGFDFKAHGYSIPIGLEYNRKPTSGIRLEADYCSVEGSQGARYHAWGVNFGLSF